MPIRFPLYVKILLWFFLNLVVLGVAFYLVARIQFRLGLGSLLAGRAGERIQAVSEVIAEELNDKPASDWNGVLENFGKAYKVQFLLFRNDGTQLAGDTSALPPAVTAKLTEGRGAGEGLGRGPPPGRGPRRAVDTRVSAPRVEFAVRSEQPTRYWVGVRLPRTDDSRPRPWPMTLLLQSDSIRGGGLFFELTPWIAAGFGALVFSLLFWMPLVRSVTRSISRMTRATEQLAEGRFEARVEERRRDELGRLGQAINRMAARLSGFVTGQKRFLGDVAHELCSPIARIEMALGILEQRAGEKEAASLQDMREDVQHMSSLVNELLSFSKASLRKEIKLEAVNVAAIARRVAAREASEGPVLQVQIDEKLQALAEPELLSRALANLVRNAIRYAGSAGPITLTASRQNDDVTITVADLGPGVPENALEEIFDPFFRVESSRSRETGGTGLGLAIVRTCVEACQGAVTARNRQPVGLEVEIHLRSCS